MVKTSYKVDAQGVFKRAVDEAKKQAGNLTVPLKLIAADFYKSQRGLFQQSGAGGYQDLTAAYKKQKRRQVGFVYPILKRTGALERSTTNDGDANAFMQIANGSVLFIGSRVPYAGFVAGKRPFIFLGPEVPRIATSEQRGRLERWVKILNDHALDSAKGLRAA